MGKGKKRGEKIKGKRGDKRKEEGKGGEREREREREEKGEREEEEMGREEKVVICWQGEERRVLWCRTTHCRTTRRLMFFFGLFCV